MESALPKHRDAVSNKTLQELFIARHGCTPRQFRRRVFWRSLHWQALFLAPLLLPARHFSADFELIGACGARARSTPSAKNPSFPPRSAECGLAAAPRQDSRLGAQASADGPPLSGG